MICDRADGVPILELGCGSGHDTLTLVQSGLKVVAVDKSEAAVAQARLRAPTARIEVRDFIDELSPGAFAPNVVLASLSLHYYGWHLTEILFSRIRAMLRDRGLLICRLNSTEDHNFGASGHPQIEPNYYLVKGEPKRFFDRKDIDRLMSNGWHVLALEHRTTDKYTKPKSIWELVCERRDA